MAKKLETHCFTGDTVEKAVEQANNLSMDGRKFEDSHVIPTLKGFTFIVVLEDFSGGATE